jgi:hypothetical protein
MSRRIKIGLAVALLALTAGTGAVVAGQKQYFPLQVNAASRYANAGLAETHNTADTVSYAECGSNASTGYCTFREPNGTYYSCFTTDPSLLVVIRSMSPDSSISVQWDASNVCTYVLSYASSRVAPRAP